jgi:hypothetical protein
MSGNSNFNSTIENKEYIESEIKTQKNFISSLKSNLYFTSIILNFTAYVTIYKIKFNSVSTMVINSIKSLLNINSSFISNSVMYINQSLMGIRNSPNIVFTNISSMQARMRMLLLGGNINFQSNSIMYSIMKQRINFYTNLMSYISSMNASATCKKYAMLNSYDANLLSTLDSTLLQDMDYTIV